MFASMKAMIAVSLFVSASSIRLANMRQDDVFLTDEMIQEQMSTNPDWDEPLALPSQQQGVTFARNPYYSTPKFAKPTSERVGKYLYRKAMYDYLAKMDPDERIVVLGVNDFNAKNFTVPNKGAIIFVIDDPFHSKCYSAKIDDAFLDDPKILAVAAENWEGPAHSKVTVLPIGFESSLMVGRYEGVLDTFLKLMDHPVPRDQRKYAVTSDAHLHPFPAPKNGYRDDRGPMLAEIEQPAIDDWYTRHIDLNSHFENHVVQAKLALCPEGNGMDTHRFYHNYALRTRCIVRKGALSEMHRQFPGTIVVDSWKEVTADNINKWSKEDIQYSEDLITAKYWLNKVLNKFSIYV